MSEKKTMGPVQMNEEAVFDFEAFLAEAGLGANVGAAIGVDVQAAIVAARKAWEENDGAEKEKDYQEGERRRRLEAAFRSAGLSEGDRYKRFDNFDVTEDNRRACRAVMRYVQGWPGTGTEGRGIILMGGFGVGKTHLCVGALNALIETHELSCELANVKTTLDRVKELFDSHGINPVPRMKRRELLVFDDLGSERITPWTLDVVSSVVSHRYNEYLPTLFTTNARSFDELESFLSPDCGEMQARRIVERVLERNVPILIRGKSRRRSPESK